MVRHYVAMGNAERCRAYRKRKKAAMPSGDWQVKALVEELRALEARVAALETRLEVPKVNALAQLRAQIAAVPPRPERIPDPFGPGRAIPNLPVQPYGEWEPS